jgi:hypothetical protein
MASLSAVFRIRDRLIGTDSDPDPWIRTLTTDPDPTLFSSGFKMPTKKSYFFQGAFCSFLTGTVSTVTSVIKDNMSLRRQKTVEIIEIMLYLNFFAG